MAETQGHAQQAADTKLENLGYVPELSRNRSTWQVMFMSFIMASVPFTISTTMSYTLSGGGPSNMVWGWVTVTLIMLCLGASLAEITSVYPTAGGVYYQTYALSPPWCRRITAWVCGWSYVAGQITITLSVIFGTTGFLIEALNLFQDKNGVGLTDNWGTWQTYVIFLGITIFCHILPSIGNKWLTYIEVCFFFFFSFPIRFDIGGADCSVLCRLLGHRRHHCDPRHHPGCCRQWKTFWRVGFWWVRTTLRLARWLVILYWFTPVCLQFVRDGNGHFVSSLRLVSICSRLI